MSLSPPHERALATALGLPLHDGRTPWAALQAQNAGLTPSRSDAGWGFVTLCHWQVNTNHMVMSPLPLPDLSATQSDEMLAAMRPYFEADGIALHPDQTGRYLAQAPILADIDSASLDRVVGHNLEHWMPSAAQAGPLLRLQNEMQMLLYTHPVNAARESQGLLPVNSFWLSGTGALLADYTAPHVHAEPIVVDTLRAAALAENWEVWLQAWTELDTTVIHDLLTRAQQGQAVQLTLCGERASQRWESRPQSAWQKFRRLFGSQPFYEVLEQL